MPIRSEERSLALQPALTREVSMDARPFYPLALDAEPVQDAGILLEFWKVIRRHKWVLSIIAFLGAALGVLLAMGQTPIYQANVSVEIEGLNQDFLNMKQVDPTATQDYAADTYLQTEIKILKSRALMSRVVDKLNLENVSTPTGRIQQWKAALGLPTPKLSKEDAVRNLEHNLSVEGGVQDRIVEVFYDAPDPKLAALVANTLAQEFIDYTMESHLKSTEHTSDWLAMQLKDLKIKLENSEDQLQTYARATGLMFTSDDKDNLAEDKLSQMQEELSKAQADRIAKQARYELATRSPADTLPDVLDDATLRDYQGKLTDLRRQRAELTALLTPSHPKVQRIEAQIAEIEDAVKKQRANLVSRLQDDYQAALRREKLLAADYAQQSSLVSDQAAKTIHYNILKREVDTNRQLYESILQRVKEAGVATALRASNIRIVDTAVPPTSPYKPNWKLYAALGLIAGTFIGVGGILIHDHADRRLQEPGEASFYLNLPELGTIPSAKTGNRRLAYGTAYGRKPVRDPKVLTLGGSSSNGSPNAAPPRIELVTWERKRSPMAESFHASLTAILFSGQNGSRPRVLALTSPHPSEGKSTVVSNLGIALAEVNQRVLIIDGDMRRPRLHDIFNLDNKSGLSDLLRDKRPVDTHVLGAYVRETIIPGLHIITSGSEAVSTHNLLYSPRFTGLLRDLRAEFDMVLIDTPPMLNVSDARVIGKLADGVILVLRLGQTTRNAARAAKQHLLDDGTKLLGVIVNDFQPERATYQRSYYSSYSAYSAKRD